MMLFSIKRDCDAAFCNHFEQHTVITFLLSFKCQMKISITMQSDVIIYQLKDN